MGTNYYLHAPECNECHKPGEEPIHIGKTSYGWVFQFRSYPDMNLTSLDAWITKIEAKTAEGYKLKDEYGEEISTIELVRRIINSRAGKSGVDLYTKRHMEAHKEEITIGIDFLEGEWS